MPLLADYVIRHHYPHILEGGWSGVELVFSSRLARVAAIRPASSCRVLGGRERLLDCAYSFTAWSLHPETPPMHCSVSPPTPPHIGQGNKYAAFLKEVAERTGRLFAEWHRVGFVHG